MSYQKLTAKFPTRTRSIYHITDTARLPWIVASGELRPDLDNAYYSRHPCAFVWATANPDGDPTASAFRDGRFVRDGGVALVRFTLHAKDFVRWSAVPQRFPQWTPEHVRRMEKSVPEAGIHQHWRVRSKPLPLTRTIRVDARSYAADWQTIDVNHACVSKVVNGELIRGVVLHDVVFASAIAAGLTTISDVGKFSAQEWAALK